MGESASPTVPVPEPGSALHRLQAWPLLSAACAAGGLYALYLVTGLLVGGPAMLGSPDTLFGLHPSVRFHGTFMLILVFLLWAFLREPGLARRELPALRAALEGGERELASLPGRVSWRGAALGGLVGVAIPTGVIVLAGPSYDLFHMLWNYLFQLVLFGAMGALAASTRTSARALTKLAREHARVDLLDTSPLRVFTRQGMRSALYWFVGSSIALLLLVQGNTPIITIGVITATVALAVWTVLGTTRGVQIRVAEAKRRELARVRDEIARSRRALSEGGTPDGGSDLPALLAWEQRIAGVTEWPFDAPTLLRFCLLVLIPVGSWLGGAIVERLLDSVLG